MLQHQGDSCQQQRINAWTFEDAINGASLKVDLPRKLRYGHPTLVEDGFDKLPDMEVLRGHVVVSFEMMTRKKRGSYFLSDARVSTPTLSTSFPRQ